MRYYYFKNFFKFLQNYPPVSWKVPVNAGLFKIFLKLYHCSHFWTLLNIFLKLSQNLLNLSCLKRRSILLPSILMAFTTFSNLASIFALREWLSKTRTSSTGWSPVGRLNGFSRAPLYFARIFLGLFPFGTLFMESQKFSSY